MKLIDLIIRTGRLIIFMLLLFVVSTILLSNFAFSKTKCIEQDSLKLKVTTKIDKLKIIVNDLNQVIEYPTPQNFSSDEIHNWYEQSGLILGLRNVIEVYTLDFRKMLDEWNYLLHQPTEGDFVQMKMEFNSALFIYINSMKEFKTVTIKAEERMEKAFAILESFTK